MYCSEPANKTLKLIAGPLLLGLADNKKPMRDATVAALQLAVCGGAGATSSVRTPSPYSPLFHSSTM
jgi:hypothetical protein